MKPTPSLFSLNRRIEFSAFIAALGLIIIVYLGTIYPDQGWGDDFAQYISQAANLSRGISMSETGYIYSRYTPQLGPTAYPPGFPLILAPIYLLFGFNIGAFQVEILVLQLLTLIVVYFIYRRTISIPTAIILLLMLGLSPYLVAFKRDVMSDVPFMLMCMLAILWMENVRQSVTAFSYISAIIAAFLIFFSYFIRTIGFVLVIALIISDLLHYRRISRFTIFTIGYTILFVIGSRILFGKGEESYLDQFANYSPFIIIQNITHYFINSIRGFWAGPSLHLNDQTIVPILWLTGFPFLLYGFVRHARRSSKLIELFFVIYILVILAWPSVQELRFLYPVLPLILLYIGVGVEGLLESLSGITGQRIMRVVALVLALGIIVIYTVRTIDTINYEHFYTDGPYTPNAQELFQFVKGHTDSTSVFVFVKPRALALYTDRHAATFPPVQPYKVGIEYLREIHANYAVVKRNALSEIDSSNVQLIGLINLQPDAFEVVFQNAEYVVYQIKLDALKQV